MTNIDWNQPIEAVFGDDVKQLGVAAQHSGIKAGDGSFWAIFSPKGGTVGLWFGPDGTCRTSGWRIRNVDRGQFFKKPLSVLGADTAMVSRMTKEEGLAAWKSAFNKAGGNPDGYHGVALEMLSALGLIKRDPTPADKFKSDHPEWALRDRSDLVDDVLAWAGAKTPLGKMLYEAAQDLTR